MSDLEIEHFLDELCEVAAAETLPRFRAGIDITNKATGGFDPVTEADRAAERALRDCIAKRYPEHGFVGEEEAPVRPQAEYCWVVDPIDGTRAYVCGLPSWGTLIGLMRNGKPIAGAMHQPFTGEKFMAAGGKAFLRHGDSRMKLATRQTGSLSDATLMTTSPFLFPPELEQRYRQLEKCCRQARYGFDCYAYAMVAAGNIDLVVESGLKTFDIAALIPLIENAGGIVTDWHGGPAVGGGDILACANRELHAEAMSILA
jgi:histidinol-phosphatase